MEADLSPGATFIPVKSGAGFSPGDGQAFACANPTELDGLAAGGSWLALLLVGLASIQRLQKVGKSHMFL